MLAGIMLSTTSLIVTGGLGAASTALSDIAVSLLLVSAPTIWPKDCSLAGDRSAPGRASISENTPTAAVSNANTTNTTATRPRMRLAPPSLSRRCRLKTIAEIMKGSTIIFSRST